MKSRFCLPGLLLLSSTLFSVAADKKIEIHSNEKLSFADGREYGQSTGKASIEKIMGQNYVKLEFDLSDGTYVSGGFPIDINSKKIKEIDFTAKSEQPCGFGLRIIDDSGECFQFKYANEKPGKEEKLKADLTTERIEHWGGNGDGKVDQPIKAIHFVASKRGTETQAGSALFGNLVFKD